MLKWRTLIYVGRNGLNKHTTMLIIFDVEGVLLNAEYLPVLAQMMGPEKEKEIWDITKQGIRGEIKWEEGLVQRVNALKGIAFEDAKKIGENLEIMPGAKELCSSLKKAGWKMIAVSGGFTIITDRLKDELGLDKIFSNELIFTNGKLDGANDLKLFSLAAFTIGFCPVDKVKEKSDAVIEIRDLMLLLNLLEKKFGKAVLAQRNNS